MRYIGDACNSRPSAAQSLLFGIKGYDPFVLGAAVAALAVVVLAAGYVPLRRAWSVAPMEALRYE